MKQSTFSAVMANSIKNLLQRYTKGIRFTAILTLLFTIGVGQIWAETYEKYSGTITEGDYLIVYSGAAMNNTVSSNRLQYSTVTISNNKITTTATTDASIVWHIAPSGSYWTIYNASANKYAASNGTKNQAQLLVSGTDDKSLWTVTGSSTYEFVNKKNKASSVNANLRRNGNYGFACYSTSTGGALTLYKKVASCTAPTSVTIDGAWDKFGGETISLTATATGDSGNYTYQWQKYYGSTWNNITDNATATTANLVYENCDGSHSGTYRCVVSTGTDCATASNDLQVKVYTLECYTNGTNIYHFTRNGNTQSGTLTLNLNADTDYKFKVHVDNDYYGNGGTINKDETNWVLGAELGIPDLTVNSGLGGTFTFTIDYSESGNSNTLGVPEISVTYPRKTIYLNPGVWNTAGAKYAIYYFIDGHDAWSDLFVGDACGTYTIIPQWNGVTMIAVRLSSDATVGTWDKKWNQTGNIAVTNNDYIAITGWGDNGDSPHTYSTYTPATYSITFNGNGNTGGSMTKVTGITCGEDHTLAANGFARIGYTFAGWATSDNGEKVYDDKATISNITSNITLYAKWTANTNTAYTVKHYKQQLDGTYSVTPDETQNLTGTTAASVTPAVKSYTGFKAPSTQTVTIKADGKTVVEYYYIRNSYTLTWNLDGGTISTQGTAAGEVKYGAALTAPTVTKTDYTFAGWSPAVAATMPAANTTYTAQWTKVYTVTFYSNGSVYETFTDLESGATVVFPNTGPTSCDTENYPHFIGWTINPINGSTDENPDLVTSATVSDEDLKYHAVFAAGTPGTTSTKVDVLNRAFTGVSGTSYSSWSGKKSNSDAVYAGQSAGGNDAIQLRSNNNNSGIVTTTSGGKATKVSVEWNNGTASGRTLNVYGKNSAYSAATDLYNTSTQGTLLGTIVCGTSTELTINGDYEYIGMRSASGAMYLDEIQITWSAGSAANYTSFITSCCQSQAVVTVAPQATELALNIDGTASTNVHISQEGAGNGKYNQPTISPAEGASLNWTGNYKRDPYDLTFTATMAGTYTITADFTETEAACPKYGTATINVLANPILVVSTPTISSECGVAGTPAAVTINSRYLTGPSLTASVATTSDTEHGTFKICATADGDFATTNLTGLTAGQDSKASVTIYVRYDAAVDNIDDATGTLTITDGTTSQTVDLTTTPTCGTSIRMTPTDANSVRVTTANGQWTRTQTAIHLRGSYLLQNLTGDQGAKVELTSSNSNFKFVKPDVASSGTVKYESEKITNNTWEADVYLVYTPTTYNANDTTTITAKVITFGGTTEHATSTLEAYGRSFPETFVLALYTGSEWVAVPADMIAPYGTGCNTGVGNHDPYPITVDDNANPTAATLAPTRAIYKGAARNTPMTNPWTIQFESNTQAGYYLFGSNNANNTIANTNQATGEGVKWALSTADNITYQLLQTTATEGQRLGYNATAKYMGQYKSAASNYKYDFRILPVEETCTYYIEPVMTLVDYTDDEAKVHIQYDGTNLYQISMDNKSTWTNVTGEIDCLDLTFTLPNTTYRGKDVWLKPQGTLCEEVVSTTACHIPAPVINNPGDQTFTGTVNQPFTGTFAITGSDLYQDISAITITDNSNPAIGATINNGTITVTMGASAVGTYTTNLTFDAVGAEEVTVKVTIEIRALATQSFNGGSYAFTDATPKVFCENNIYDDIATWKPEIHLSHALYMDGATISTTDQLNNNTKFTLIDLNTGESLSFTREVISGGIAKITLNATCRSKMVPGHTYRLSWENTNQVMTDENGLPYMDCHMDFVYSENCDAPTALPACPITNSGFTANWVPVADCTGDVTVDVYTKQNAVLQEYNFTTSGSTTINAWSQRGPTKWFIGGTGVQDKTTNGYEMLSTNGGYNVYSPQLSNWKSDITTDDEVKITLVGYNNRTDATTYALKLYVVENANMPTSAGRPTTFKTVTINGQSTDIYTLTLAAGRVQSTGVFTIEGLSATDRFFITSSASSSNCLFTSIKMESSAKTTIASKTISCNAGSAEFTGLSANITYYYTVGDGNGNNSNEIAVTTYSGAPSLKYYSDEACTTEITETKVLGGEETTVYVKGANISACELVPSVTTGYAYDDSGLSYKPSTGDVSGKIILTLTDPANTISGTLTIAGYPLDLISSDCPAGFNNMAKDATDVTSNSAQANWNSGLNFGDDPSGTLLLYENGEVFVELVENGDFETGSLNDGWSSSIHTGPSDGNKAFNEYELVDNSLYITDNAGCGTLANFHNMTLMYANYVTLKPGTYRMKAQVKVPEVSGNTDKEKIFAIGLVQSGLSVVAVSPEKTVLSNNTYDEIIYEFELANEMTVCPAIGARQDAGEFRKFYIDNVSLMRIKCPGPGDLVREIPITDLGTGFEEIEGLKPNTEYTYVIKNVNDCESNEITFYTGQGNYMPMQVVEWKENSVVVMYTGSETNAIVMIGSNTPKTVALTQQDVAIYELPITGLIEHPTEKLYITIGEGFKAITIPYIISATKDEDDLTTNRDLARTSDIVILNEGKLNITKTGNAAYQYHDITIYGGGKMVVEGEVKIASLTMRIGAVVNRAHQALYPQLVLKGQIINSSRQINLDYLTTYDRYYALSVPYPVLTESIHYPADIYGDNLTTGNKASFALQWYDGEARASETRKGWKDLKEPATLAQYQGYTFWGAPRKVNGVRPTFGIHRIPMPVEDLTIKSNETSNKQINVYAHSAANAYDAGWNFLGNPYLAQYGNMEDGDTSGLLGMLTQNPETGVWEHTGNYRYITLTDDGKTYWQTPVSEAELYPFNTFFVQAGENGAVSFNASNRASLPARHYAAQQVTAKEITTGILLTGNDQTDRTGLLIADNFTEEYDYNADLSKFENSGINLYTIGKDGKLAYMAINQTLAEQPIPVGYSATADGEYIIAFDADRYNASDISALYLIDYDRNEKTNLLHTDYSFVTAAGTNNQRFALQVAFAPENATNVEWVGDATVQVGVEGNTLMLNNLPTDAAVHVFDALGRLMYHAPTVPTEMQLTLPTGYYLVRIADKQNAVVIKTVIP